MSNYTGTPMATIMQQFKAELERIYGQSAGATPDQGATPLVGTGEMVLLPRALAEEIHGDLCELRAEWQWKKDEPRAGNAREYAALVTRLDKLGAILHGQENAQAEGRRGAHQ